MMFRLNSFVEVDHVVLVADFVLVVVRCSSCSGIVEFTSGCLQLYPLVSNCSTWLSGCCFHHVFGLDSVE